MRNEAGRGRGGGIITLLESQIRLGNWELGPERYGIKQWEEDGEGRYNTCLLRSGGK